MNILFHAHSGLRYLVLLAGLVALAYFLSGLVAKRPFGKGGRVMGAIFAGLLDLQMLLGLVMVALGRYYPRLIGHIVMMILAIGVTHALLSINRKRPNPGYLLPVIAVAAALVLIVGAIMAIGRGVLTHTSLAG
ncbi:hypothetical protein [Hyalangium rubrum]|uniref:Uncharacterized protein n=1 Tax=Hyalangium rubrum TaxID=3103134 RepID=A0ABU5H5U2_9BACT|nr:hypothetical protein [Hyalangium sp. s54d21]MDY7228842.1 hypothetical protein [Hyalangium sp. s54d21]